MNRILSLILILTFQACFAQQYEFEKTLLKPGKFKAMTIIKKDLMKNQERK